MGSAAGSIRDRRSQPRAVARRQATTERPQCGFELRRRPEGPAALVFRGRARDWLGGRSNARRIDAADRRPPGRQDGRASGAEPCGPGPGAPHRARALESTGLGGRARLLRPRRRAFHRRGPGRTDRRRSGRARQESQPQGPCLARRMGGPWNAVKAPGTPDVTPEDIRGDCRGDSMEAYRIQRVGDTFIVPDEMAARVPEAPGTGPRSRLRCPRSSKSRSARTVRARQTPKRSAISRDSSEPVRRATS